MTYRHVTGTDFPYLYRVAGQASAGQVAHVPGAHWTLAREKHTYHYGVDGLLRSIAGPLGSSITYTYSASNPSQLTRVTSRSGRFVSFEWSANRVSKVTAPNGAQWHFAYDASGMLSRVTGPGADPDIRTYHYESPAGAAIADRGFDQRHPAQHVHVSKRDRKVAESGLAGGEKKDRFHYTSDATTVTNAHGHATTYRFGSTNGVKRLLATSKAASNACGARSATIAYTAAGHVDYEIDWRGIKTDYTFDADGRLVEVTHAAGTPSQHTERHTWTADRLTSTTYRSAQGVDYKRVSYSHFALTPAAGLLAGEAWLDLRTGAQRDHRFIYAFHPNGAIAQMLSMQDLGNGVTATSLRSFNASGDLIGITNPAGHTTTMSSHNGLGQPATVVDANGVATAFSYRPDGHLLATAAQLPNGIRGTSFVYNHDRQLTDVLHATGAVDRFRYEDSGDLSAVGDAIGNYRIVAHDLPTHTYTTWHPKHHPHEGAGGAPFAVAANHFSGHRRLDAQSFP